MTTNAAKLYRKIINDKSAQAELAKAGGAPESIAAIVRLGEAHGLPVTPEEVRDFLAREPDELTDHELEMIAAAGVTYGSQGDDSISGGAGSDYLFGGYGLGNDTLDGGAGDDSMVGGAGNDSMDGGSGNDTMMGGYGDDTLDGGAGDDRMSGNEGNDSMEGGAGHDSMVGGEGDDTMFGQGGNDRMVGGEGNDILTGGAGKDVFVFGTDDGNDSITDFNPQKDRLLLQGAEAGDIGVTIQDGNTVITYGQTTITLEGVEMDKYQVWERVQTV